VTGYKGALITTNNVQGVGLDNAVAPAAK